MVPAMSPNTEQDLAPSLERVHSALRHALETIVGVSGAPIPEEDRAGFAEFSDRFARFLETHHDGEEEIIFPALSQAATKASLPEAVASVKQWRADHEKVVGALQRFEAACAEFRRGGAPTELHRAASEVQNVLFPHLDAEEAVLDTGIVAKLLTKEQVEVLAKESSKHGQRVGGPKVLMLFIHGLSDEDQRLHFSEVPWLVRKVLMKRVWARDFSPCLKYAFNPSFAL